MEPGYKARKSGGDSIKADSTIDLKSGADVYCRDGTSLYINCELWLKTFFTLLQHHDVPEMFVTGVSMLALWLA